MINMLFEKSRLGFFFFENGVVIYNSSIMKNLYVKLKVIYQN